MLKPIFKRRIKRTGQFPEIQCTCSFVMTCRGSAVWHDRPSDSLKKAKVYHSRLECAIELYIQFELTKYYSCLATKWWFQKTDYLGFYMIQRHVLPVLAIESQFNMRSHDVDRPHEALSHTPDCFWILEEAQLKFYMFFDAFQLPLLGEIIGGFTSVPSLSMQCLLCFCSFKLVLCRCCICVDSNGCSFQWALIIRRETDTDDSVSLESFSVFESHWLVCKPLKKMKDIFHKESRWCHGQKEFISLFYSALAEGPRI